MKKTSKFLSVFLALLMVITIIPISNITASAEDILTSGTCGNNLIWEFDELTHTLTISGKGDMYSYFDESEGEFIARPWEKYIYDIYNVVIDNGVTSIGDLAFYKHSLLQYVEIRKDVKSIGKGSFAECQNLTNVVIPDNVTTIEPMAFMECRSLDTVVIGAGITEIKEKTFYGSIFDNIVLPKGIAKIGESAFYCSIDNIYYIGKEEDWNKIEIADDNSYLTRASIVYDFYNSDCNFAWSVFDGTTYELSFLGSGKINSIYDAKLPVLWYPDETGMLDIIIGDNISSIGERFFTDLVAENITIGENVSEIGDYAFYDCIFTNIIIDENNPYFSTDGKSAIFNKDKTELIQRWLPNNSVHEIIPYGVTTIRKNAVYNCREVYTITIPETVTTIEDGAFSATNLIEGILYFGAEEQWNNVSIGSGNENIVNAEKVYNHPKIASGKCGDNLTWTFDETTGLLTVSGTGEMYDFSAGYFPWNSYIQRCSKIIIESGVKNITDYAFLGSYIKEVEILTGVEIIGNHAFQYCSSLKYLDLPASVTHIGDNAFFACDDLVKITVDEKNSFYASDEYGVLFNKDKNVLIQYPASAERNSYTIPDSVETIEDHAFDECWWLEEITIPDSVTTIGEWAFGNCGFEEIVIPDGVTSIGDGMFYGCQRLRNVVIPDSVTKIGNSAFNYCINLPSVAIPDGVISIGEKAFYDCRSLINVVIPDSVTTIGDSAFSSCDNLTSITIGNGVETIGSWAFSSCRSLISVVIPDSVTSIGYMAFCECENLTDVTIGDGVTSISKETFLFCRSLANILVDSNNQYYSSDEYGVLFNKDKTILIQYPIGNTRTGYTIPDGVTTIGENAFDSCRNLTNITIPNSVTTIGNFAFFDCSSLTDVYYTGTEKQWNNISIAKYSDSLLNATIHYIYTDIDSFTGILDDYFYKDGVRQKAYQLVELDGDYYFINDYNKIAKNTRIYLSQRFVEGTDLKVGYYNFDENGKLVNLNGPVGDYFYKDGIQLKAYQLVEFEGDYYFINNSNKLAKNTRIYLSARFVEGTDLKVGYYNFDADGKLVLLNGPVGDYFYKDNVRLNAYQLVEFDGDYYFINDSHKLAKNKRIYLSERFVEGTDLKVGYYEFDAEGKMVLLNGPVGDYFYKDNVRLNAYQLVEFEGNYYFINDSHKLAKNKRIYLSQRFVEGTDLKVGYYEFDADGKMIIE